MPLLPKEDMSPELKAEIRGHFQVAVDALQAIDLSDSEADLETRKRMRMAILDSQVHIPSLEGPLDEEGTKASSAIFEAGGVLALTGAIAHPENLFGPGEGKEESTNPFPRAPREYHQKRTDIPRAMEETRELINQAIGHLREAIREFGEESKEAE